MRGNSGPKIETEFFERREQHFVRETQLNQSLEKEVGKTEGFDHQFFEEQ